MPIREGSPLSLVAEYVVLKAILGNTVGKPVLADLFDIESRKVRNVIQ